jgi:hypothetical protein
MRRQHVCFSSPPHPEFCQPPSIKQISTNSIMGSDLSRDLRKQELKDFSVDIEDISKTIYEQIKICSEKNKIYLYEQLGRLHYTYYEYMEQSLLCHIKYIDTGNTVYFEKLGDLYISMMNNIMELEKEVMRVE